MSQWDKLFQQKLKEVMHHKHRDYEYASLSPTASGNVARALIAEEYSAQADRIAELQKQLDTRTKELIGASFYEHDYKTMMANNEPVAWMLVDEINGDYMLERHPSGDYDWIPLYTQPLKDKPHPKCDEACMYLCQMRELTDEEIMEVATINLGHSMGLLNWMGFARAILRKAKEK